MSMIKSRLETRGDGQHIHTGYSIVGGGRVDTAALSSSVFRSEGGHVR